MKILLVHQNFPGQFRGLAPALMLAGHEVRAVSMRKESMLAGVRNSCYSNHRGNSKTIHPWLISTESAIIRGEACAAAVEVILREGWIPELILGHTGWGEMLFLRAVVPSAKIMGFNELYYQPSGGDLGFDPEFVAEPEAAKRLLVRNLHLTSSLMACDLGITPTQWQADCFPPLLRERIQVIHDGIETDKLVPDPQAWIRLEKAGVKLKHGDEVVTFVNRNLEPMRGYHQFMRALPEILSQRERAHVVIVGGDGVSYGKAPTDQKGFREIYFNEVKDRIDLSRVHFVNRVPYESLVTLLRISAAHVYLTVPFVLSWSMLEAMSLGALVIGSSTPPVQEVIEHERNGLLVDFFSPADIAQTVCKVLAQPVAYKAMRAQARQDIVERYDFRQVSLPRYMRLIQGQ